MGQRAAVRAASMGEQRAVLGGGRWIAASGRLGGAARRQGSAWPSLPAQIGPTWCLISCALEVSIHRHMPHLPGHPGWPGPRWLPPPCRAPAVAGQLAVAGI